MSGLAWSKMGVTFWLMRLEILLYLKNDLMVGDDFLYADDDATIFYYAAYIAL